MESFTLEVLLWVVASILVTIVIMYILFWVRISGTKSSFLDSVDTVFDNFCQEMPDIGYREPVHRPSINGVYERHLAIALIDPCFKVTKAKCTSILPIENPPGFNEQLRIEGIDPNTGEQTMFAYLFWNVTTSEALIVFIGTNSAAELKSDVQFHQVPPTQLNNYIDGVLVHRGFYNIYLSIRDQLWNWWNANSSWVNTLYITGHSLGAALSSICCFDFARVFGCDPSICSRYIVHYSFAPPRSGNPRYAREFNMIMPTSLRVNNTCDIVPQLPPAAWQGYVYEEVGQNVPFTVAYPTLVEDHILAYFENLPECPVVAQCHSDTPTS